VGDEVLARVAAVASAELRAADAIGRYGGDEFVMVLPMTTAQQAYHIAERMRTSIAEMRLDVGEGQVAVTVSIGIADVLPVTEECPGGVCSLGDILYRADAAMYLAKAAGRNRISVYSS
jgi:diguanylate cyclase (GGDEF)-like protein